MTDKPSLNRPLELFNLEKVDRDIFSWNGVGRMAVEAIFQRDYPIIQGFILTFAVVVVIVSIFLDTIYAFIDPRIRRG